jgi:integrase
LLDMRCPTVAPPTSADMKRTLNDRIIRSLKAAPAGKRYEVMDTVVPGLGVRLTDKGAKTFILIARYPGSENPTRRALGEYGELTLEQARATARDWHTLIGRGLDPKEEVKRQRLAEQRKRANTFAAVAEDFIEGKLPSERRGKSVEQTIRREFIPAWGGRPITEIAPLDVRAIVKRAKDRGAPYQAHALLATARRLFNWAIEQHAFGLETSPCDRLKPRSIIGDRKARSRILSADELRAVWKATETMGYPYGPLLRLLAFTGQRKSEVADARWSEFDLEQKLWTIPAARMKADAPHVVPLSDAAIEILRTLPRFERGDHLFSTTFGVKPVNGFSKAKEILDRKLQQIIRKPVAPFVIHDIRRTMRTGLSALPIPDLVRELVIAHTKPGLHKVYDQFAYLDEKRDALDRWAGRLRDIVTPPPDNVIVIQNAR